MNYGNHELRGWLSKLTGHIDGGDPETEDECWDYGAGT